MFATVLYAWVAVVRIEYGRAPITCVKVSELMRTVYKFFGDNLMRQALGVPKSAISICSCRLLTWSRRTCRALVDFHLQFSPLTLIGCQTFGAKGYPEPICAQDIITTRPILLGLKCISI
jgi:hypothetical protein